MTATTHQPTVPGSQVTLRSGSILTLFNDGMWHDLSNRAYAWEQIPSDLIQYIDII